MAADRQTLKRIVALLVSLAGLAERAAARPLPVLCLVLMLLRPAEAIARRFIADLSPPTTLSPRAAPPPPDGAAPSDASARALFDARTEAFRLALAFRTLAFVLNGLAAAGCAPPSPLWGARNVGLGVSGFAGCTSTRSVRARPPHEGEAGRPYLPP